MLLNRLIPSVATETAPQTSVLAFNRGQMIIAVLLFAMIVLNYLDRQALSVVAPMMRKELGITVMQYAWAVNAFLTAYALMYVGSGVVLDRLGYRTGLALFVSCWSAFAALHSLTAGIFSLVCFRFLLGLAEPAGFTGAVKTIALRFTPAQRGIATGVLGMGTGLGTLIAPPLIVFLSLKFGWRTAFLVAGGAGALWVPFWLLATRPTTGNAVQRGTRTRAAVPRNLSVLAYAIARFFGDSSGYFVMFWMPEYLVSSKHFSFVMLGTLGWIPPCGSDIGAIAGGYLSSRLVARGLPPILSRKILMTVASALLVIGACLLTTTSTFMVLFSLTVCTLGVGMGRAIACPRNGRLSPCFRLDHPRHRRLSRCHWRRAVQQSRRIFSHPPSGWTRSADAGTDSPRVYLSVVVVDEKHPKG